MADEQHAADDINFNEAVKRQQFGTLDAAAKAHVALMDRHGGLFMKMADEISPVQALAINKAGAGG